MTAQKLRAAGRVCVLGALGMLLPLVIAASGAEPLGTIPNPRVRDGTWVTDLPGALRPDTVSRLNAIIDEMEKATGAEMAVVVVRSLDGLSVDDAATRLFELWKIGKAGKDNGLLLLWSTGDRRVRIEVGYGLEGILPDGKVGAILDAYVIPKFKSGEFDEGVLAGVTAVAGAAQNRAVALPLSSSETYDDSGGEGSSLITPTTLGLLGAIPAGLGSLVGFRKWRRYRRRQCPQCQAVMARLSEAEDDAHLGDAQRVEERVGSIDYDVWKCPSCSHHFTLRYPKWLTSYAKCPQCQNHTKSSTETVLVSATTSSSGSARVVETCAFCSFRREFTKTLPRIQSSSSGGSSRSSSSSFGGGRSGGGGASRGY